MHPSHGMGIELATGTSEQGFQTENFIQFLASRPGITPELLVSPYPSERAQDDYGTQSQDVEDPLLDLLRHHESFSEEMFLQALRGQRNAEFVQE
jgi:hypothetical protein